MTHQEEALYLLQAQRLIALEEIIKIAFECDLATHTFATIDKKILAACPNVKAEDVGLILIDANLGHEETELVIHHEALKALLEKFPQAHLHLFSRAFIASDAAKLTKLVTEITTAFTKLESKYQNRVSSGVVESGLGIQALFNANKKFNKKTSADTRTAATITIAAAALTSVPSAAAPLTITAPRAPTRGATSSTSSLALTLSPFPSPPAQLTPASEVNPPPAVVVAVKSSGRCGPCGPCF